MDIELLALSSNRGEVGANVSCLFRNECKAAYVEAMVCGGSVRGVCMCGGGALTGYSGVLEYYHVCILD